ncbi:MAG: glycosyltransferase family 4 protein [Pseudobutyrivibrio sp.]|nr:glycosyltransferase family 4 protein [Pseudobutyrivibrio sp.]
MKVLSVAWNVFGQEDDRLYQLRNGGSIMIADICEYIGRKEDSYLFLGDRKISEQDYGHIKICSNEKWLPEERTKDNISDWQVGLVKSFKEQVNYIKPDYVLVHGAGEFAYNIIKYCMDIGQSIFFVCHLYIGNSGRFDDKCTPSQWENRVCSIPDLKIIFVGNGMKKRFIKEHRDVSEENLFVVVNGTKIKYKQSKESSLLYLKEEGKKILMCSGSLQPRKNQLQLVEALKYVDKKIRNQIKIVFVGTDLTGGDIPSQIKAEAKKVGMENSVVYIGSLPAENMGDIYSIADGLAMTSFIEGVSLVALEALVYGIPIIMFKENETGADVFDEKAVIMANSYSNQDLAKTIEMWFGTVWDGDYIKDYAKQFSMERVSEDYVRLLSAQGKA